MSYFIKPEHITATVCTGVSYLLGSPEFVTDIKKILPEVTSNKKLECFIDVIIKLGTRNKDKIFKVVKNMEKNNHRTLINFIILVALMINPEGCMEELDDQKHLLNDIQYVTLCDNAKHFFEFSQVVHKYEMVVRD
jgi:hypothetical protein